MSQYILGKNYFSKNEKKLDKNPSSLYNYKAFLCENAILAPNEFGAKVQKEV